MLTVLRTTWPLLLGILLLMVGNGMQGTLLGIRGEIEGIATTQMSLVMAGYFGGFVLGSRIVPAMIQRVGHVRVFAALGSLISAVLIVYAAAPHWIAWALLRLVIGFCFCGVYITAESWVNASAANETRGQAMSAYFVVQMLGLVAGQVLMNVGDPGGWMLFVIPSVLVSLAFTPILLARVTAPRFETIKPGRVPYPDGRMQAPHITMWVVARGINIGLQTRMYFPDEEKANGEDPVLGRIEHRVRVPTLIAEKVDGGYRFDIHLQGEKETVFFDI